MPRARLGRGVGGRIQSAIPDWEKLTRATSLRFAIPFLSVNQLNPLFGQFRGLLSVVLTLLFEVLMESVAVLGSFGSELPGDGFHGFACVGSVLFGLFAGFVEF